MEYNNTYSLQYSILAGKCIYAGHCVPWWRKQFQFKQWCNCDTESSWLWMCNIVSSNSVWWIASLLHKFVFVRTKHWGERSRSLKKMFKLIWKFFEFPGITETNAFYWKWHHCVHGSVINPLDILYLKCFFFLLLLLLFVQRKRNSRQENNEVDVCHLCVQ